MNEPKSKTLNTTRSIAVLIHLKSLGVIYNTYSDFNFNPEHGQPADGKNVYFKITYLNGVKDKIEIEAPVANGRLLVNELSLKVNNRQIVLHNIRLDFKGIKDFKELRIIERVRIAGKTNNFLDLLNCVKIMTAYCTVKVNLAVYIYKVQRNSIWVAVITAHGKHTAFAVF